ncbi:hypothetical protein [Robertmurraya andreesenii]|uniref:Flagellar basal body-associated protein FliL n=1 Tax=Anoxybacillus andreesenii TaxID=1325932 RepID=A0ABT9V1R9_9BACL|nr:hypothetical protein [Robertmurraya andreesenii]MDQ0154897.1 flagellar basal body-associated protein FliL [Robertmurraya andreesenii]
MGNVKRQNIVLVAVIILLAGVGLASMFFGNAGEVKPIAAESMSDQERAELDVAVLTEELSAFDISKINVNYSGDIISVYIDKKTSEQYVEDYAKDVVDAVKSALVTRKSDMTLEKDRYNVTVYGTDGLIKIAST